MNETKNFLNSLTSLRDSTKYVLDFLNNKEFNLDTNNSSNKNDDCTQAFDILSSLKKDVQTFTNTNFKASDTADDSSEEFQECQTANLDNLHSQLSMIVDSFNSDLDILNSTENSCNVTCEPKLDIVLSHQETLKSIDNKPNNDDNKSVPQLEITSPNNKLVPQLEITSPNKEITSPDKEITSPNKEITDNQKNKEISDQPKTKSPKKSTPKLNVKTDEASTAEPNKSSVAKNFLFTNTMPQTPELEKIKNYVTDVDLNKLNNIEIIKLILDSLVQNCNEILLLKSDTLSDVLGAYPKSPISDNVISIDQPPSSNVNQSTTNNNDGKLNSIEETNNTSDTTNTNNDTTNKNNGENSKPKTPRELLKELECLIILIHSLYDNIPTDKNVNIKQRDESVESEDIDNKANDSVSCVLTSNAELNSVINAIDSLLKSSPRFNNQCVQINAESKKKFQLMGVLSVVDRMTRTRLNDQRATPNQLDRVNRLIDLLNNSLVRQYVEQRFTISPDKERRMELGRISHLVEKSKNSRLTNQDWVSKKLMREKEIEDIFEQTTYKTLENQRFVMAPSKERDMYFSSLLNRVDKLDSYRLSNQDAVIIKRTKAPDDSLCSMTESDVEIATKTKEGPIKRLRRFSKSIK